MKHLSIRRYISVFYEKINKLGVSLLSFSRGYLLVLHVTPNSTRILSGPFL